MAAAMETDEDPAVELVRGMHPKLRRRLEKFLKTQYPVRLLRRNAVDVLKKSFSDHWRQLLEVGSQASEETNPPASSSRATVKLLHSCFHSLP